MSQALWDTHDIYEGLVDAGVSQGQAKALTSVFRMQNQALDGKFTTLEEKQAKRVREELATRADLEIASLALKGDIASLRAELKGDTASLRTELKGDIASLRTELKGDIADLRNAMSSLELRLIRWVIGMGVSVLVTIAGLMARGFGWW